jgi:hypothetical protein
LPKGYLLNCRCENKSPKASHKYEEVIKHFIWFARRSGFPDQIGKVDPENNGTRLQIISKSGEVFQVVYKESVFRRGLTHHKNMPQI